MRANDNRAYRTLCERFGTAGRLYAAKITLFWDSQTYMPKGGAWARGEQLAAIDAARRDLIAAPDADQLFAETKQGFSYFHHAFGVKYPFGKYDQAYVPEFNAGASTSRR